MISRVRAGGLEKIVLVRTPQWDTFFKVKKVESYPGKGLVGAYRSCKHISLSVLACSQSSKKFLPKTVSDSLNKIVLLKTDSDRPLGKGKHQSVNGRHVLSKE